MSGSLAGGREGLDPTTTLVIASEGAVYPPWPLRGAGPAVLLRPGLQVPLEDDPEAALLSVSLELGVTDIVVYGHTECAELRRALRAGASDWPNLGQALRLLDDFYQDSDLDAAGRLEVLVQENALAQVEALREHPALLGALAAGALKLHAWVHQPGVGEWRYDPGEEQFVRRGSPWGRARRAALPQERWSVC